MATIPVVEHPADENRLALAPEAAAAVAAFVAGDPLPPSPPVAPRRRAPPAPPVARPSPFASTC